MSCGDHDEDHPRRDRRAARDADAGTRRPLRGGLRPPAARQAPRVPVEADRMADPGAAVRRSLRGRQAAARRAHRRDPPAARRGDAHGRGAPRVRAEARRARGRRHDRPRVARPENRGARRRGRLRMERRALPLALRGGEGGHGRALERQPVLQGREAEAVIQVAKGKKVRDAAPATTRVAIYCRQPVEDTTSTFNSLEAQRGAVEAYVTSQRGEGWVALPERYDDGGFSGANTERPAFKRLLAEVEAGRVDVVAVYKIDRLSRSMLDFVRLMEVFRRLGVTFVSVTQQFSTTNAVGRMTLNLLATFAEFEREQISERTQDKIQAARRRGMWTGGRPPLGYDLVQKRLVPNKEEADRVRAIFALYLESGSLMATVKEL